MGATFLLQPIGLLLQVMNGGYRMLRLPVVVRRHEDRLDTRNQLFQPADCRHSSTLPTATAAGACSRIHRSLDPTHSLPKNTLQLAVPAIPSAQSRWLIEAENARPETSEIPYYGLAVPLVQETASRHALSSHLRRHAACRSLTTAIGLRKVRPGLALASVDGSPPTRTWIEILASALCSSM